MIEMNGMRYSKFPRRSDVGPIELKYYVEDVDRHGNIRRYFRRKGQRKIRLPGLPGSVEFMDAYRSALANLPEDRPRTVGRPAIGSLGMFVFRTMQVLPSEGWPKAHSHGGVGHLIRSVSNMETNASRS